METIGRKLNLSGKGRALFYDYFKPPAITKRGNKIIQERINNHFVILFSFSEWVPISFAEWEQKSFFIQIPEDTLNGMIETFNKFNINSEFHDPLIGIFLQYIVSCQWIADSPLILKEWSDLSELISLFNEQKIEKTKNITIEVKEKGKPAKTFKFTVGLISGMILKYISQSGVSAKEIDKTAFPPTVKNEGGQPNYLRRAIAAGSFGLFILLMNYNVVKTHFLAEKLLSYILRDFGIIPATDTNPYNTMKSYFRKHIQPKEIFR